MRLDAGAVLHGHVVQRNVHLLQGRRDGPEQDDEEVVDLPEGDLRPDPSVRGRRVPLDIDLPRPPAVRPGQHLQRRVAAVCNSDFSCILVKD